MPKSFALVSSYTRRNALRSPSPVRSIASASRARAKSPLFCAASITKLEAVESLKPPSNWGCCPWRVTHLGLRLSEPAAPICRLELTTGLIYIEPLLGPRSGRRARQCLRVGYRTAVKKMPTASLGTFECPVPRKGVAGERIIAAQALFASGKRPPFTSKTLIAIPRATDTASSRMSPGWVD